MPLPFAWSGEYRFVPVWQERPQDLHLILRAAPVQEHREGDPDLPANVLPVLPSLTEAPPALGFLKLKSMTGRSPAICVPTKIALPGETSRIVS